MIEHLIPPEDQADKVCGCEVQIPETAIMHDGRLVSVVKTEKDGCVVRMRMKMKLQELRKVFSAIIRTRRRDNEMQLKTE